jgi:hypothetical protein
MIRLLRAGLGGLALLAATAAPGAAMPMVEDNLAPFLVSVGDGTGEAWMAFESSQSKMLDQLFYRDRSAAQKLSIMRQAIASGVPVWQVRQFYTHWRSDFDLVASRMEQTYGPLSGITVSAWYCADPRMSVYGEVNGRPTLALNIRPMMPYDSMKTKLYIAQELFRYYAYQVSTPNPEEPSLSRRVQFEGLTMAAMQRALPGLAPHQYMMVPAATYKTWERNQTTIARGLKNALERPESANAMERFFGRGFGDPWPNGAGRYMAYKLSRVAAKDRGPLELNVLPSRDYMFLAQAALDDMAKVGEGLTTP